MYLTPSVMVLAHMAIYIDSSLGLNGCYYEPPAADLCHKVFPSADSKSETVTTLKNILTLFIVARVLSEA